MNKNIIKKIFASIGLILFVGVLSIPTSVYAVDRYYYAHTDLDSTAAGYFKSLSECEKGRSIAMDNGGIYWKSSDCIKYTGTKGEFSVLGKDLPGVKLITKQDFLSQKASVNSGTQAGQISQDVVDLATSNTTQSNVTGGANLPISTGGANPPAKTNVKIINPIADSGVDNLDNFIKVLLEGVIKIGIPIVALAIIYSGFLFVAAQGNEKKLGDAKNALMGSLIGAAVLLGSWAIAQLISNTVLAL